MVGLGLKDRVGDKHLPKRVTIRREPWNIEKQIYKGKTLLLRQAILDYSHLAEWTQQEFIPGRCLPPE